MDQRMKLSWGGGQMDVFIDIRRAYSPLLVYGSIETQEIVHQMYPGGYAHHSGTGRHGGGWIPADMGLRMVGTYRVDQAYTECRPWDTVPHTLPGVQIQVPVETRGGWVTPDWPILVRVNGSDSVHLTDEHGLWAIIRNGRNDFFPAVFTQRVFRTPDSGPEEVEIPFLALEGKLPLNGARALRALNIEALSFQCGEHWYEWGSDFWRNLGILPIRGNFFKVAQKICFARYTREELSSVAALQAAAPKNVKVLAPWLYLQESAGGGGFTAHAEVQIEGSFIEVSTSVDNQMFVAAVSGDTDCLEQYLEASAQEIFKSRGDTNVSQSDEEGFSGVYDPYSHSDEELLGSSSLAKAS